MQLNDSLTNTLKYNGSFSQDDFQVTEVSGTPLTKNQPDDCYSHIRRAAMEEENKEVFALKLENSDKGMSFSAMT